MCFFFNNALCSKFLLNIGCVLSLELFASVSVCLENDHLFQQRTVFLVVAGQPHSEMLFKVHLVNWRCLLSVVGFVF